MARGDDLSKPKGAAGAGPVYDPDEFGRLAERLARFFGTPRYIIGQTVLVVIWIILNVAAATLRFDPYPFILLNLAFSTQAAYAAPLILLAQNRQADRDKEETERDREMNARSLAETEYLAREIAAVRLAVDQKADRSDILEPLERLEALLERLAPAADAGAAGDGPTPGDARCASPDRRHRSDADARPDGLLDPLADLLVDVLPVLERTRQDRVRDAV